MERAPLQLRIELPQDPFFEFEPILSIDDVEFFAAEVRQQATIQVDLKRSKRLNRSFASCNKRSVVREQRVSGLLERFA